MPGTLFDARWLRPGMTGVGKYALHILEALPPGPYPRGLILPKGSLYASRFPGFRIHEAPADLTEHPWTDLFEQVGIPWLCMRNGYRSFVSFEGRVPAVHPGFKTFSVIYDLSFLKVPGSHNRKYSAFLAFSLRVSAWTATRIVTISEAVKSDLRERAGIPESRLLLVHPADSRLGTLEPSPIAGLEKPFFLAVSMTNPRKNLAPLLKAFSRFNSEGRPYRLALTGNPAWIAAQISASGCADAVNLGFVEDRELAWLYREAEALVYPSLDEGFGIPLVDASGFGCPVLCSDLPVFREVMGEQAVYFSPESPDSISEALDSARRRGRNGAASDTARRFNWEASARALADGIAAAGG